jgi:CPA1 family monovalent cation:H+ antiporter
MRGVVSLAAALSIPETLQNGAPFPHRNLILFITFSVILVTLILQGLTLPPLIKWLNMADQDYIIPIEQQKQLVRKKMAMLCLSILENKYSRELKENDMVKSIKIKIDADMELLIDWDKKDTHKRAEAFYHDYRVVLDDLMNEQRNLLKTLNKKEEVNEAVIRHQLILLDLEQEKLQQHFSYDEE